MHHPQHDIHRTERNTAFTLSEICHSINNVHLFDEMAVFETKFSSGSPDSFPLRIDALLIILVREGVGRLGIDLQEYDITPGTLIFLQPKNYIHFTQFSDDSHAQIIACSRRMVHDVLPKLTDALPLLMRHRASPVHTLQPQQIAGLTQYYTLLRDKLSQPTTPFLKHKVVNLLQAALYEMMDIQLEREQQLEHRKTRKEEIMARFIIEVTEGFRTERQVSHYAKQLCITPKHLSAVVKEVSGMTAGEWIDHFVIMEAKVLLKTTDMTVQEISSRLNFANQGFFGKYFKHITGFTPSDFRKQNT